MERRPADIMPNRLQSSNLSQTQISKIKGTGRDGMLTKGDVLLALGEIKNAYGSAEKLNVDILGASGKRKSEVCRSSSCVYFVIIPASTSSPSVYLCPPRVSGRRHSVLMAWRETSPQSGMETGEARQDLVSLPINIKLTKGKPSRHPKRKLRHLNQPLKSLWMRLA